MKQTRWFVGLVILTFLFGCGAGDPDPGAADAGGSDPADAGADQFLQPPPAEAGFQVDLPPFEVAAGQEIYYCYRLPLPADSAFDLQRLEQRFSLGAHHLLISTVEASYEAGQGPCSANDFGFEVDLLSAFNQNLRFLAGAQTPYSSDPRADLVLEEGTGFRVVPDTTLLLQVHWANTTDQPQQAHVAINFWYANEPIDTYLDSFFFYHTQIELPPNATTEVAGRCIFPDGLQVVGMVAHTHARGIDFTTHSYDSGLGDLVYQEPSWQEPVMKMWSKSQLLELGSNTGLEYRCTFQNTTNQTIYEGDGADEEMCMLIGLYTGGSGTIWGFPGASGLPGNVCTAVP